MTRAATRASVELTALVGLPIVEPGDDLVAIIVAGLARSNVALGDSDVLAVASKVVSRAEDRFVDLARVTPSARAQDVASRVGKDPRLVELILGDAASISREAPGVLIVRHRLGLISANAAIDTSNAQPPGAPANAGPWVLRLPDDPDASAARLRDGLVDASGARVAVVVTDSLGRPFRSGTVGAAIGVAGLPALVDLRGRQDLGARALEHTEIAFADQVAAAADLVAGQGAEGRAVVHIRGLVFDDDDGGTGPLYRDPGRDLYA